MSRVGRRKPVLSDAGPPLSPLPPPLQPATGLLRWSVWLLIALYIGLAAVHAMSATTGATGYQNAPDEAAHVQYVRAILQGHLPTRMEAGQDATGRSYEWHQPPLYYALDAPLYALGGERAARVLSILCGVLSLFLILRFARLLFPDAPLVATVAVGIAALTPSHIALTSVVNNDALLEVCFSAALLSVATSLHSGFTLWRAGWLGVAIGCAILTKLTGLLLLPVVLFALVLFRRSGEERSALARSAAWMACVVLLLCGWWFVRNWQLYGEPIPLRAFAESFAGTVKASDVIEGRVPLPLVSQDYAGYLLLIGQWTFQSFWAVYGNARSAEGGAPIFLHPQLQVYLLFGLFTLAAVVGLIILHFRRRQAFTEMQLRGIWLLFVTLGLVGTFFLAFVLRYFQTQGRYLYPAMLPICVLLSLGWRAVLPQRYQALASGLLLTVLGLLSVLFLLTVRRAVGL